MHLYLFHGLMVAGPHEIHRYTNVDASELLLGL